jgi:hypothetical protein
MARANFSQRRTLDGSWRTTTWRDDIETRRDVAVVVCAGVVLSGGRLTSAR